MTLRDRRRELLARDAQARDVVLDLLRRRYVREKQHAMRYRQHAETTLPQFRETLINLAAEEEKHAELIGAKMRDLGEDLPDVLPIHVAKEDNSWSYLRTDLEEEQRCTGELSGLPVIRREFPEIVELLERLDTDSRSHRARLRDMLARSVPQPLAPP